MILTTKGRQHYKFDNVSISWSFKTTEWTWLWKLLLNKIISENIHKSLDG